ncbi:DEAD/DEAH box helicase [Salinicoccus halodurans]|uniref:Helicase conserved C-terminal domain-containing protein n=1 Tax=Salinicoccus halodurans TaxID=407035 RepID=A0AA94KVU0_9STAP|nr:DEAD/DEAH box helicase [Salinicoccus halodurans]SFK73279.1 Helicase conserved C-terminal domain-containing protein [Salinicoccus halodurans]
MINNKKDVIKIEKELDSKITEIRKYGEDYFNPKINELWQHVKTHIAQGRLKEMHIDTISTIEKGMPINNLVNAGFKSIYDVADCTPEQFLQIRGVGEKSAYPLHDAVSRIKQSVHARVQGRIDPDNLSELDYDVLRTIYSKQQILIDREHLLEEIDQLGKEFKDRFDVIKTQKNFFMSLFQSKEAKGKISREIDALNESDLLSSMDTIRKNYDKIINFGVSNEFLRDDFISNNIKYYTEIENGTGYTQKKSAADIPSEIVEAVNGFPLETTGLKGLTLRHYQEFGAKYILHNKRILLGDEMGLGKTIQALAAINHLRNAGKSYSIVVCPLSVVANWKREVNKFSDINTYVYHGKNRDKAFDDWLENEGVLITTFSHTRNMDKDKIEKLDILIVDEAHFVKNPGAKRSKSVYELSEQAEYAVYMSGTPLENRLEEMKQLLSVLQPRVALKLSNELHLLEPQKFKREIAPVYLRRNRADVLGELPELEVIEQWSDFSETEQGIYENAVASSQMMKMRRAAWAGGTPADSPKLEALVDICEEAKENGHKVLVFSFFRDVITVVQNHLTGPSFPAITGDIPNAERQQIIDDFTAAEPGAVLVSQITAGGVGLNIQAANIIILCEPQWKPSIEEQAISRAYRMGQSRNVVVYRLLTEDSIDVSMMELLDEKSQLFNLYARDSEVADIVQDRREESDASLQQQVLELEKRRLAEKQAV